MSSASYVRDQQLSFQKATGIHSKLHAIGRLDADTTGLLLLTNDGGLVHHVTNPTAASSKGGGKKLVKTYEALIMGYHTLDENEESSTKLRGLLDGVDIGKKYGGMTLPPEDLEVLDHPTTKTTLVRISISEGKNRQVRRMFHAINSGVIRLHRSRIGELDLGMLDGGEGCWRMLTEEEVLKGLGWKCRYIREVQHQPVGSKRRLQKRISSSPKQRTKRRR